MMNVYKATFVLNQPRSQGFYKFLRENPGDEAGAEPD